MHALLFSICFPFPAEPYPADICHAQGPITLTLPFADIQSLQFDASALAAAAAAASGARLPYACALRALPPCCALWLDG